jgi:hypothetical protein
MKCIVCGRASSSLDEDGICPRCDQNTKITDRVYRTSRKRSLTQREFEVLLSEIVNE